MWAGASAPAPTHERLNMYIHEALKKDKKVRRKNWSNCLRVMQTERGLAIGSSTDSGFYHLTTDDLMADDWEVYMPVLTRVEALDHLASGGWITCKMFLEGTYVIRVFGTRTIQYADFLSVTEVPLYVLFDERGCVKEVFENLPRQEWVKA